MDACESYTESLLDERLPRRPGLEAHLAGCEKCRSLQAGHRSAKALVGVVPAGAPRVPRRAVVTRLALAAALGSLGVGYLVLRPAAPVQLAHQAAPVRIAPERESPEAVATGPGEGSLSRAAEPSLAALRVTPDGWQELAELTAFARRAARTNPSADPLYAGRSPAASYLAMARQDPMAGLGIEVSPLFATSEE